MELAALKTEWLKDKVFACEYDVLAEEFGVEKKILSSCVERSTQQLDVKNRMQYESLELKRDQRLRAA
jgi:hypothetical protein